MATNYSLTMNNPPMSLEEFHTQLLKDSRYARCQLEKGAEGTIHIQACVGYKANKRLAEMRKKFPGCHIEVGKSARHLWDYCGKEDSRIEGPL